MLESFILRDRSVVVAADVDSSRLIDLVEATDDIEGISGYKVGLALGLELSLPETVRRIKFLSNLPVIYDHQKAGNDIPEMDENFARVCAQSGVDAVILFPFSSPVTEERWIKSSQDKGLRVLVGGHMTVPKFLVSEGGFIADSAPPKIYTIAAENGVRDFIVPGNKVGYVQYYRTLLEDILGEGNFDLHAPGFITQGGQLSEMALVAGKRWHAIVGSGIYGAKNEVRNIDQMRAAAELITAQIR